MTTHTIALARHTAQVVGLAGVLVLGTWDSYGTEQLLLRPGPEWDGLAIDATFHSLPNDEGVTVLADTGGLVTVPPEACMRASKYATITIRGVQDGVQRISCNLPYIVLDHAQVPGANSTATPSENAQALAQMQDLRDGAVDAKNQAEAARDGAANSATAAAASERTASDAAAGAADAKAAAVAAQKDAAASKAAAANSSAAAKTSEDAAAKSAADADSTANSINNSMMQIAANKEAVSQLKEDLVNRGKVNGGKNLIGNKGNKLYAVGRLPAGTKLTISMKDGGLLTGANLKCYDKTRTYLNYFNAYKDNKRRTFTLDYDTSYIALSKVISDRPMQLEIGEKATEFQEYTPNVAEALNLSTIETEDLKESVSGLNTSIAQSFIFSSFGYYKSGNQQEGLGSASEKISADFYNSGVDGSTTLQAITGKFKNPIQFTSSKKIFIILNSSITGSVSIHLSSGHSWAPHTNPLIGKIIVQKGFHCYEVDLYKQLSDDKYNSPKDFEYILFEIPSKKFENLVFDAYVFDNSNLLNLIRSSICQTNDYDIIFWGDSLTAGAGGNGTTYPKVCSDELGITSYLNAGVGGETANTIACRNGANNMIIPIGSVNGTYSIGNLKDAYGTNILPLRQGTGGDTVNPIVVNGHECTLSLSQTSATDSNATYTISGYTGEPIKYPMPCKFSGCGLTSDITVIFVGQNGPSFEQRLSIIDSIISRTNGKYVVLTLSSGTEEQMKSQEATMLTKYGNHLFKTREALAKYGMTMMNISPTEEDTVAMSNGSVPPSLRTDSVHLNASGYTALGKMLATHIRALGYIS